MQAFRSALTDWSEPWSKLGLGLFLWDDRTDHLEPVRADSFWTTLVRHSPESSGRLIGVARKALQGRSGVSAPFSMSGLVVTTVIVRQRQRPITVVLALALHDSFDDEETRARFCTAWQMDRTVCERLAADLPRFGSEALQAYAVLLAREVESLTATELARRDVRDLSSQLARAYEELHLMYRLRVGSSVSTRPQQHFTTLCDELIEATLIESLAVVLETSTALAGPSVIRAGPLDASDADILRLYAQVRGMAPNAGTVVVLNGLCADPAFAWATTWLQQFIFAELNGKDRQFGGILAVNHQQGEDFGSYEIQLISAVAERSSAFLENARLYDDLEHLFIGMLHALVNSIDAKDPYTRGHSQRVAWLSRHIAHKLGLSEHQCQRVYLSGLLHDIGKIGISEGVLCKDGLLTREEYDEMKLHPSIGARILERVPQVEDLIPGVLAHHERIDGRGYPNGLTRDNIPLFGRIVGLADTFDAMTTHRTYRRARPLPIAAAEIRRFAGTQFDAQIADLFLREDLSRILQELANA